MGFEFAEILGEIQADEEIYKYKIKELNCNFFAKEYSNEIREENNSNTKNEAIQNLENKGDDDLPYLKEGTIRKITRGKNCYIWEARYYDENRKQKSVTSKNQAECIKKLKQSIRERDFRKKHNNAAESKQLSLTVIEWMNKWLTTYKQPYVSQKRYEAIASMLRIHVYEKIGSLLLTNVTTEILQTLLNNITSEASKHGTGSRTRVEVYQILLATFDMATKTEIISKNPLLIIKKPQHKRVKGRALTLSEQIEFFDRIKNHPLRFILLFYVFTGARRNEALAIRWTDINYENNFIHVRGTKTESADRIFPLYNCVKELLAQMKHTSEYVFDFKADYVSKSFKKILNSHKLHDLRHTFITRCGEKGMNTKAIASIVGHSDDNITKNLYFTALSDFVKTESEKMQDLFSYDFDE